MNLLQRLSVAVELAFGAISRWVDPAMPWLFLALRRALIATLVAVVVALLFFVVPQSREVLRGLGEPPLKSLQDFDQIAIQLINYWGYGLYSAGAVALGLATWYAARLLATVEAQLATPGALAEGAAATGLQTATTWLPRGLGTFVLGAAIGALLYANYTPRLSQLPALALVALAISGPLLVAAGTMARSRRGFWLGVAATLVATVLLALFTDKWRIWLASIACSALPAALLWFLCTRRRMLERLGLSRNQLAHQPRTFGEVIVTLFMVVAASVLLLLLLALLPTPAVRMFGSAAAVLLFLAASVLFLAGVQILLRRAARNVPGLTSAALVVFAAGVAVLGDESLGDERLDAAASDAVPAVPPAAAVGARAAAADAAAQPRPFYVNAHGGGLRAAVFTAQVLARADDATCGSFGEKVAAFSGVSGGSLGIATYLVARQEHVRNGGWLGCTPGSQKTANPLTNIVLRALVQDHLSPAMARLLAVDAPHLPWAPTRGQALLDSWQSALVESLAEARKEKRADPPAAFAQRLGALTGGMPRPVSVYFNATNADTGHIVWFSNRAGGQVHDGLATYAAAAPEVTVGQAVLHSARFPIVSPAGGFRSLRLVDGGYADNSGTTTLLRALREEQAPGQTEAPWLLNIDGNPPEDSLCGDEPHNPPLLTALRALLQARSAHAALAVNTLKDEKNVQALDVTLDLERTITDADPGERCKQVRRVNQAPLGWYMSYGAAKTLAASVDDGVQQICAALGHACTPEAGALQNKP
ncbi:MAG: patatin-like phospholipase family protein [Burkholderiales bacterium]|nr:patatin-like phospholipase family protein [Burkholderiales bacterium]